MSWSDSEGGLSNAGGLGGGGVGGNLQRGPRKGAGGAWVGPNNGGGDKNWTWGILDKIPGMLNTLINRATNSVATALDGGEAAPTRVEPDTSGMTANHVQQVSGYKNGMTTQEAYQAYADKLEPGLENQGLWTILTGQRPGMDPATTMLADTALGMIGLNGIGSNMFKAGVGTAFDRADMLKGMEEYGVNVLGLSRQQAAAEANTWNVNDMGKTAHGRYGGGDGDNKASTKAKRETAAIAAESEEGAAQSSTETGSDEMKPETIGEEYAVAAKKERRKRFSFLDTLYNEGWGATGAASLYKPSAGGY